MVHLSETSLVFCANRFYHSFAIDELFYCTQQSQDILQLKLKKIRPRHKNYFIIVVAKWVIYVIINIMNINRYIIRIR